MNSRAFTLIELLVVIAIVSLMSAFVLGSFSRSTQEAGVAEATNSLLSFMRKARQNAVSVLEHPGQPGVYPSYGIHINIKDDPGKIILYADCKADDNDSGGIEASDIFHFRQSECNGNGKIEELKLNNAHVTSLVFSGANPNESGALTSFNVLFIRPEPTVWFSGTTGPVAHPHVKNFDVGEARITISNLAGTESKVIRINSVGLIVIE